jgi:hypothetical protein
MMLKFWKSESASNDRLRESVRAECVKTANLPPMADLTNDEDREMKALTKKPGTYNIIYVLESIKPPLSSIKRDEDNFGNDIKICGDTSDGDEPQAIILKHFEAPDKGVKNISRITVRLNSTIEALDSRTFLINSSRSLISSARKLISYRARNQNWYQN